MKLRRLRLRRRGDQAIYLDRWGIETRAGGIYLHRFTAPDPGPDMHDHPFMFASLILKGGYTERVASIADLVENVRSYSRGTVHTVRLDQCHQILAIIRPTWTLVVRGPRVRWWGFYTPTGFVPNGRYTTERRDLDVAERKAA